MVTRRLAALISIMLVAAAILAMSPTAGATAPFNFFIAKSARGIYKSKAINASCPKSEGGSCTNAQEQKKTIARGKTATFYVKVKNPNRHPSALTVEMNASDSHNGFTVQYYI
jgi:hypothetical protein